MAQQTTNSITPSVGKRVFMSIDDSVDIVIAEIVEALEGENHGVFRIRDQYGAEHFVEREGESWVTINPLNLD